MSLKPHSSLTGSKHSLNLLLELIFSWLASLLGSCHAASNARALLCTSERPACSGLSSALATSRHKCAQLTGTFPLQETAKASCQAQLFLTPCPQPAKRLQANQFSTSESDSPKTSDKLYCRAPRITMIAVMFLQIQRCCHHRAKYGNLNLMSLESLADGL